MTKKEVDAEVISVKTDVVPGNQETTAVISWEERLAGYAAEAAAEETVQGTFISLRGGRISIDKQPVAGNVLDCVVIAYARENAWYPGKFDPNNPVPPRCYAIQPVRANTNELDMAPHVDVEEPVAELCDGCPKNEWKSGDGGKGKACKNVRRLALIPADALKSSQGVSEADVLYLKLPVLSVQNWSKYVNAVAAEYKRPPFAMVTQISTEPDAKAQFKVTFKPGYKISDPEILNALVARNLRELDAIDFPYGKEVAKEPGPDSDKF